MVPLISNFFFIRSTIIPKNKSKRRALFSACGGAYERLLWYEYEAGKEKITVYSLQKTRLHQWLEFDTLLSERGESTLVCVCVG